jgi:hypothetical protein
MPDSEEFLPESGYQHPHLILGKRVIGITI